MPILLATLAEKIDGIIEYRAVGKDVIQRGKGNKTTKKQGF